MLTYSTVHGGPYDTKCVTFEQIVQAAFVGERMTVVKLEPARIRHQVAILWYSYCPRSTRQRLSYIKTRELRFKILVEVEQYYIMLPSERMGPPGFLNSGTSQHQPLYSYHCILLPL